MASHANLIPETRQMSKKLQKTVNVVFFGKVGNGKTSLVNRITGETFQALPFGESCTRQVQYATIKFSELIAVDLPGSEATHDIMKHLDVQLIILRSIPVKLICLVLQASSRTDSIIGELGKLLPIFQNHISNLVIFVTKTDDLTGDQVATIHREIGQNAPKEILGVLCTKLSTPDDEILRFLTNAAKRATLQPKLIIPEFYLKQLVPLLPGFLSLERKKLAEWDDLVNVLEKYFSSLPDDETRRASYFYLRDESERIAREFYNEGQGIESDDMKLAAYLVSFQSKLHIRFTNYMLKVFSKMDLKPMGARQSKTEYRECPNCHLIWLRYAGCDGFICGRRTLGYDLESQSFTRFCFRIANGILTYTSSTKKGDLVFEDREIQALKLSPEEEKANQTRIELNKTLPPDEQLQLVQPKGCGFSAKWPELADRTSYVADMLRTTPDTSFYTSIEPFDIRKWLGHIDVRCESFAQKFIDEGYDKVKMLQGLTDEDLHTLGVGLAYRKLILSHLPQLLNEDPYCRCLAVDQAGCKKDPSTSFLSLNYWWR